jgi:hypothetical protein
MPYAALWVGVLSEDSAVLSMRLGAMRLLVVFPSRPTCSACAYLVTAGVALRCLTPGVRIGNPR